MPTPHVHAELIKAWADGAEIEHQNPGEGTWHLIKNPSWWENKKYRIKQQPKPKVTRWLWACKFPQDIKWLLTSAYYTDQEFKEWTSAKGIKLEWSAMEFDE